jgi:superfamily II DNA or RNA helicase
VRQPPLLLGLTADPWRDDFWKLREIFGRVLRERDERDLKWGILHGWLVDLRVVRVPTNTSLDDVTTSVGDLDMRSLETAVNVQEWNADAVKVGAICGWTNVCMEWKDGY